MIIKSGDHNSFSATVNSKGQLLTNSTSVNKIYEFSELGESYVILSNFISFTTTAYNGVLYVSNTSSYPLHITQMVFGSTANARWKMWRSPTTGTLITAPSATLTPVNLFAGSGKSFTGMVQAGGEGYTVTNGVLMGQWVNAAYNTGAIHTDSALTLTNGTSIAFTCSLAAAGDVFMNLQAFYDTED